jgi:PAS domain S-box-containing protein
MPSDLVRQIAQLKPGDHICSIYENTAERLAAAVAFIKMGLTRGQRCLHLDADDRAFEEVSQGLAAAGVDVARERARGALRFLREQDTYLPPGGFSPETMLEFVGRQAAQALADGFAGLWSSADMTWSVGQESGNDRLVAYEARLNRLAKQPPCVILCQYERTRFDAPCIHDVLRTHPLVILGRQLCANPYYELPEIVLAAGATADRSEVEGKRVDWWLKTIADWKRAQDALRESQARLEEAERVAHVGYWENDLDADRITWSDETYRILGLSRRDGFPTLTQFRERIHPEDRQLQAEASARAKRGEGRYDVEYRVIRPDGTVRIVHSVGDVIQDESGRPCRAFGVVQDITERKETEQALRESEELYRFLTENCNDIITLYDIEGRRVYGSPSFARVLGWIPPNSFEGIHPEDLEMTRRVWQRILAGEKTMYTFRHAHADGSWRWLESGGSLVSYQGKPHVIAVSRDVTERKQADEALRESAKRLQHLSRRLLEVQEAERRHLARELHDEFGQVLAGITLHLYAAKGLAGEAAVPRLDECAALLRQAGDQVRNLALELRPTMLDSLGLEATLHWLAEHHQQRTSMDTQVVGHLSGATLSSELAIACFRVVQEALTNVARHSAARHVRIELSQSESGVDLVVRDDGVGFDVPTIQAQAAQRGSLGLLGMRERIQILGGSLEVESEPGRGTRIRAAFPLVEAGDEPAEPAE